MVDHRRMSAAQIIECSYQAMAIVSVCRAAADAIESNPPAGIAVSIEHALAAALELMGPVHDALETRKAFRVVEERP